MVLDGLINSRVIRVEAVRLGLTASDAEVAAEIRKQFKPEDGKPFDQNRYEQYAIDQYGSVTALEESFRDQISGQKLRAFVSSGVTVSEEEVIDDYKRRNTKFDLSYVLINPTSLAQSISVTDDELKAYFEENKQSYYIGVPQKKIKYLFLSTAKIGEKLPISDDDLRAEYDNLPADRRLKGVNGREIVLRIAKPEFEGQVLEKANELVAQLRKDGTVVSEEKFAELAKGHSENAASASRGGALPGMVRENLNDPSDAYQRLFELKTGEISDPINFKGRYFILRRGEDVPKTFEDARKELDVSLRNRRAYEVSAALAEKVTQALKENKDVERTARDFAAEANMNVADMIRETAYVKPGDNVDKIGISPQFEDGIAGLESPNDVGDKIPVPDGFAIPLLADRKEARDAEFEEVRERLIDVVKLEKARDQVEQIATAIAAGSANAGAVAAAAESKKMKALESKSFTLGSPLGEGPLATTNSQLEDAIYALSAGEATKTPVKVGENYYVIGVSKREEADMEEFAKQRTNLMEQMLSRKRGEIFSDYLASVQQKLESAGRIRIYQDALAKIDAADSTAPFGGAGF
jgi:peptidyl-prolyl cis-trans isomerase D